MSSTTVPLVIAFLGIVGTLTSGLMTQRLAERAKTKYRSCSPWGELPDELDSFQTAHKRLIRWAVDGTWERILAVGLAAADESADIGWTVPVDSPVRRARQHAAGVRKRGLPTARNQAITGSTSTLPRGPEYEGASRQRQPCRPLALRVTAGQAGDAPAFEASIRVPRSGPGRPRTRPEVVLGDRAYSSRVIRGQIPTRDPCRHSAAVRPGWSSSAARSRRRSPAGLRHRGVQTARRRRTMHQPAQAVAWRLVTKLRLDVRHASALLRALLVLTNHEVAR